MDISVEHIQYFGLYIGDLKNSSKLWVRSVLQ